jgi:hypothetical protein
LARNTGGAVDFGLPPFLFLRGAKVTNMAAKKRRKSRLNGLGGSRAHHYAEAKKVAKSAVSFFGRAAMFARKGDCSGALRNFAMGSVEEGKTIAHQSEANQMLSVSESGKVVDGYEAAENALKAQCFVGKLAGMHRRSRR